MWGAIIGDIVGSRFEHNNCRKKDFMLFTARNRFTDDTLMTLAVAKALCRCGRGSDEELRAETVRCMRIVGTKYPNAGWGMHLPAGCARKTLSRITVMAMARQCASLPWENMPARRRR